MSTFFTRLAGLLPATYDHLASRMGRVYDGLITFADNVAWGAAAILVTATHTTGIPQAARALSRAVRRVVEAIRDKHHLPDEPPPLAPIINMEDFVRRWELSAHADAGLDEAYQDEDDDEEGDDSPLAPLPEWAQPDVQKNGLS